MNGNISKLLEEANEAYYWAGFIAADGHITKDNKRIVLYLSIRDKRHLLKFAQFIKCSNIVYINVKTYSQIGISIQDRILVPKFAEKFNLRHNKTYNPPNLNWLMGDKFLAFLAGFIDGDGCIKKQENNFATLTIHCHKAWFKTFKLFEKKIYLLLGNHTYKSHVYLDKRGFVCFDITNSMYVKELKKMLLKLKVPLLLRKWNRVNIKRIGKFEKAALMRDKIFQLLVEGYRVKHIAKILNVDHRTVVYLKNHAPQNNKYTWGITNV